MRSCFVRALWGDELIDKYDDRPYEVAESRRRQPQPEPAVIVTFGRHNTELAHDAGWPMVIRASADPVVNVSGQPERNAHISFGLVPYGVSQFVHKFLAVAAALRAGWDECVFLDFETKLTGPLPSGFWHVLHSGQPLQCSLYQYRRSRLRRYIEPRIVAAAESFYCRDARIMDECLNIARSRQYRFRGNKWLGLTEEAAMRILIDQRMGGWKGVPAYVSAGYQFPYHAQRHGYMLPPLEPLFINQRLKDWSKMVRAGIKCWEAHVDSILNKEVACA